MPETTTDDADVTEVGDVTDDELAELAERAVWFDPFADGVVPFEDPDGPPNSLLPEWYMPAPTNRLGVKRRLALAGLALGLVVINVGGFCVTYGFPEFVWS